MAESGRHRPSERNSTRKEAEISRAQPARNAGSARIRATASHTARRNGPRLLMIHASDQAPAVEQVDLGENFRLQSDLIQQRIEWKIALPSKSCADGRDEIFESAHEAPLATKVIEQYQIASGLHHALHLAEHGDGIWHRADGIGRHGSVELVVAEVHDGGVHVFDGAFADPNPRTPPPALLHH